MIIKVVKEYGTMNKRQRIDFNKSDGLIPGMEVYIIPKDEYSKIENSIMVLENDYMQIENEVKIANEKIKFYEDQEQNLNQLIKDAIAPIDEHYQKELEIKDNEIKQLKMQLKTLQAKTNQYNLELMGLSAMDILFRSKHKKLIKNYSDEIAVIVDDHQKVVDVDAPGLPGKQSW